MLDPAGPPCFILHVPRPLARARVPPLPALRDGDPHSWRALTTARRAEDAFRIALSELIGWLEEDYGFSEGEAILLLGQVLDVCATQFVNPHFTYVAKVARVFLLVPLAARKPQAGC